MSQESGLSRLAPEVVATLAGRRIGLLGFDTQEAARIASVLRRVNSVSSRFEESWLSDSTQRGDALMIKLGAVTAQAMQAVAATSVPILITAPGESLLDGAAGAYGWARELVSEPWSDAELLFRLFRLIAPVRDFGARAADRSRPLVLIADDDPALVSLVEVTLRTHGFTSIAARDGLVTLRLVREILPDLLVLDVHMPGMDGFEVLETIRRDPWLQHLQVILLTACDGNEEVSRGAALRADDYLVKPLAPTVLLNRIKRLLGTPLTRQNVRAFSETPKTPSASSPTEPAVPKEA